MVEYLLIAFGGAIGTVARYWLGQQVILKLGAAFPWGTLLINISGSFLIGFFATLTSLPDSRWVVSHQFRNFFMVGICGGYTTFSAFSLQTMDLTLRGQWLLAGFNVLASVVFCLLSVWLGHVLALALTRA